MDAQSNNEIHILIKEELKSFQLSVTKEIRSVLEGLSEEIKSMKKDIINLSDKITSLQSSNNNSAEDGSEQQDLGHDELMGIKMECFENSDEDLHPSLFNFANNNSNGGNTDNSNDTEVIEPQFDQSLIKNEGIDDVENGLQQENYSEEFEGIKIECFGNTGVDLQPSFVDNTNNNFNRGNTDNSNNTKINEHHTEDTLVNDEENVKSGLDSTSTDLSVSEQECNLSESNFLPKIWATTEELDDTSSVKNRRSSNQVVSTNKKVGKQSNRKVGLSKLPCSSNTSASLTKGSNKKLSCEFCGKQFSWSSSLKQHIRTHTGEKPFKCKNCEKCFSRSSHLKSHIRIHTGEKPFKCKYCNQYFAQPRHLKRHIITHAGEKSFECKECDQCFADASNLIRHIRTHTGEKPFKCKECNQCFTQSSILNRHIRTHTREKTLRIDDRAGHS